MALDILSDNEIKALLLVAHPDDETIFCGGTMLSSKCSWTVVCVTEGNGNALKEEFEQAIEYFKKFKINNSEFLWLRQKKITKNPGDPEFEKDRLDRKSEWETALQDKIMIDSYNIIFTHNEAGEYGHEDHKLLNEIVNNIYKGKNIWEFICPGAHNCAQPYLTKTETIPLNEGILEKKTEIFNNSYKTQLYNWRGDLHDVLSYEFRTGPEIFTSK